MGKQKHQYRIQVLIANRVPVWLHIVTLASNSSCSIFIVVASNLNVCIW